MGRTETTAESVEESASPEHLAVEWRPRPSEFLFILVAGAVLYLVFRNESASPRAAIVGGGLIAIGFLLGGATRYAPVKRRAILHEIWSLSATMWLCATPWLLNTDAVMHLTFIPILAVAFETPAMTVRRSQTWRFSALAYTISYSMYLVLHNHAALALVVVSAGFAALSGMGLIGELIARLVQQRDANQQLAHTDVLTGLRNRRGWHRALAEQDRTAPFSAVFTCVVFDLDHFKRANERFGHLHGDAQLRRVADLTSTELGDEWTLSRVGGDEFAAIARGDRREDFDRVRTALVDLNQRAGERISVTAGVGVAASADEAWVMAVGALRVAKRSERGSTACAGTEMDQHLLVQREVSRVSEHEVRSVVDLAAQPITTDGAVVGFECLARWSGAGGPDISPTVFVPVFEEAGMAHALGHAVVEKAIEFAAELPEDIWVSVNISPSHFQHDSFAGEIARLLGNGHISPDRLTIEVTESQQVTDHKTWAHNAARLRRLGVGVAVDDFGAGWSSIDRLIELDLTHLKVDRSVINQLHNHRTRALLNSLVSFTRAVGIQLIAEGVEQQRQLEMLTMIGVDAIQGYLTGMPMHLQAARDRAWAEARSRLRVEDGHAKGA